MVLVLEMVPADALKSLVVVAASVNVQLPVPLKVRFQKGLLPVVMVLPVEAEVKVTVEEAALKVPALYQVLDTLMVWVELAVKVPRISKSRLKSKVPAA